MRVNPIDKSILRYKNLIWKCMKGIKLPPLLDYNDLEQAGYIGLYEAIKRYRPESNNKFITYAYYYVRGYILREMYSQGSLINKPIASKEDFKKIVHLPLIQMERWCGSEQSSDVVDKKLDYYSLKKLYDKLFKLISPRQRRAIELYYFTINDNGKHLTYNEVGSIMGISHQRAAELVEAGRYALKKRFGKYLDVYV